MGTRDFNWSPKEKKIAKDIFDKAYQKEMTEIKDELVKRISMLKDFDEIWRLHDYLSHRRKEVDKKYDYRYSVLINVFVRLYSEGYIKESDLDGLDEEKINVIKFLSQ